MEAELEAVVSTSYEGSVDVQGRWDGHGRVSFKSGATYDGTWRAGRMHGHGKFVFPDGISYEGEFQDNQLTGTGVYTWPSGAQYEGTVVRGRREGRGRLSFTKSAAVYEGDWRDGLRHGQGVLYTNVQRSSYYRGQWLDDTKHGAGVMRYDNGDVYDGQWEADKKRGLGTMRWESSRQQYAGEWDNNVPNGAGLHVWFSEQEAGIPTHAQLLMHNRYYGHFKNGRRHGYGVLYYATGARYEGYWQGDLKHGQGCYVFENGEVWAGAFAHDRPGLAPGEAFAPASTGVQLQIDDLVEEEENPTASRRAISNLLLCYNTELRMLYDKYCKRPSHQLPPKMPRLSFSVLAAQVWELANDCRLLSPALTLSGLDAICATSRLMPERLRQFRSQETPKAMDYLTPEQVRFWRHLATEHAPGGGHSPVADLTFRAFAEVLVRAAAARFAHLPSLERRLHQALTLHVLHLVNKAKATLPSPPSPTPVLPPNIAVEAAVAALDAVRPRMAEIFLAAAGAEPPLSKEQQQQEAAAPEARGGATAAAGGPTDPVYGVTAPARALAAALEAAAAAGGRLAYPLGFKGALLQLLWNYVSRNAYGPVQRMTMEPVGSGDGSEGAGFRTAAESLAAEDEQELMFVMDQPLSWAEFVDGVWRIATDWAADVSDAASHAVVPLSDRLGAVLGLEPEPEPEPPAVGGGGHGRAKSAKGGAGGAVLAKGLSRKGLGVRGAGVGEGGEDGGGGEGYGGGSALQSLESGERPDMAAGGADAA
ncbi:hypothetical protein CHLRE_16g690450v5 [Chlamydomonas reinhardtii]|uniref:Radial spoke protein 10 n=1 Tax=Chlamydomonas reinhardtii TaxID=3055 RepID=A0A2K3CU78_CHLRE|nr:uncharacterized protein CHLRE_16g690450v5 [Chlamydomonas reinhardtii]PNW71839.1 hypothetical protein CHLRE_16g690450v5 [Chlamydomonas reinhardtii]7SQC_V0 Chain V0, FAP266 [Chlamydomonas reinhardtii]7SQC_V1 Chain V1, FAP266 [Chlamydomonas reinhardtii]